MKIKHFTKEDTLIYKGVGILLIVFHNFFHLLRPYAAENQTNFDLDRVHWLFFNLKDEPFESLNLLFSYFGHFGVQLFIFISGVGLVLSMKTKCRNWGAFMVERLKKLYPLLFIGFIFLLFYEILCNKNIPSFYYYREFFYKLLFLHTFNITKGSAYSLSGPWWFFGLIFQLYVLFPLLYRVIKKYNVKAFLLICMISYSWIFISQYVFSPNTDILLFLNSPGHLPEFALGILFALNPDKKMKPIYGILALVIFALGSFYKLFFPFTFLSITVVMYWGLTKIIPFILNRTQRLKSVLLYYGSISMVLFVIHGPLRFPFHEICGHTFYMKLFTAFLFIVVATALSILGNMMYQWMVNLLKKT